MKGNVKGRGFTLIEVLVTMVIISLVSTLAFQTLNTTSKALSSVSQNNARLSEQLLPTKWFADSFRGAVLYHPNEIYTVGERYRFAFLTISPPSQNTVAPDLIEWNIIQTGNQWHLGYKYREEEYVITTFEEPIHFQYLHENKWSDSLDLKQSFLPKAVSVSSDQSTLILATPLRNPKAKTPTEMAVFGQYEF